jgi:hypothetical protein
MSAGCDQQKTSDADRHRQYQGHVERNLRLGQWQDRRDTTGLRINWNDADICLLVPGSRQPLPAGLCPCLLALAGWTTGIRTLLSSAALGPGRPPRRRPWPWHLARRFEPFEPLCVCPAPPLPDPVHAGPLDRGGEDRCGAREQGELTEDRQMRLSVPGRSASMGRMAEITVMMPPPMTR